MLCCFELILTLDCLFFIAIFAAMKIITVIVGVLFFLFLGCRPDPKKDGCNVPLQDGMSTLDVIDSLMWSRPDSALMLLQEHFNPDDPYAQLLLAELLYKNDYAQSNRGEVLRIVEALKSSPFLSSRAHYINGVGYYENDSVEEACQEYFKALEIMEDAYSEKELNGVKAQFMSMTFTRLTELYSRLYYHDASLYYSQRALDYMGRYKATPWHVAWLLHEIGIDYDVKGELDSACYYYRQAMEVMPDKDNLMQRDICASLTYLEYQQGHSFQETTERLKELCRSAISEKEKLFRYAKIGAVYYKERLLDSAWVYLNDVFEGVDNIELKAQSAMWLNEICKEKTFETDVYKDFLASVALREQYNSVQKSTLTELFKQYVVNSKEKVLKDKKLHQLRWIGISLLGFCLVAFSIVMENKKKRLKLEDVLREERQRNKMTLKALEERLIGNEATIQKLRKYSELQFFNEPICKDIMELLEGRTLKRDVRVEEYSDMKLSKFQLNKLSEVVEKHFQGFSQLLSARYPKIRHAELNQCRLCLLQLEDTQIAALLGVDYSTIKRRALKMKKEFGTDKTLQRYITELFHPV